MSTVVQSVPPLFIKDSDIGAPTLTPFDMCTAAIRATNASSLEGVQKINGLWRLYFKDKATRLQLCISQRLLVNGINVPLYDKNPYTSGQQHLQSSHRSPAQVNDKLTIKDIPLSVSNESIKRMLEEKGIELVSPIKYGLIRDQDGHLTEYKSGDRYVFVKPFSPPLPRKQTVGNFSCVVIHHGRDLKCKACDEQGHKVGDAQCKAKPTEEILAFRSYQHCLSNHFACQLRVFDEQFPSLEHAYFWYMANEFGNHDLAVRIKNSEHAGVAKRLSKQIASDEERWEWEKDNVAIMKKLLEVKAQQCLLFHDCLIENKDKLLVEATPSKFWASGLSQFVTEHCSASYWPGQNMLGVLLMEITQSLLQDQEATEAVSNEDKNEDEGDHEVEDEGDVEVSESIDHPTSSHESTDSSDDPFTIPETQIVTPTATPMDTGSKDPQSPALPPVVSFHRSRSRQRLSVEPRTTRSHSPTRKAFTPKAGPKCSRTKDATKITQDIRIALTKTEQTSKPTKRNTPSSSPDLKDSVSKVHKADNHVA